MSVALGLVAIVMLIFFLAAKELLSAGLGPRRALVARTLNIGIVPFMMLFLLIIALNIVNILGFWG